jgi:transcriptional regulator with XRE-family HTH domain
MANDIYDVLAGRVRHERARAGLTLEALAEKAGVSDSFIAHIETGRKKPSLVTVHRLAVALSLPLSDLLSEDLPPLPKSDAPFLNHVARIIRGKSAKQKDGLLRLIRIAADVVSISQPVPNAQTSFVSADRTR